MLRTRFDDTDQCQSTDKDVTQLLYLTFGYRVGCNQSTLINIGQRQIGGHQLTFDPLGYWPTVFITFGLRRSDYVDDADCQRKQNAILDCL